MSLKKPSWKEVLNKEGYLQLPVAHDALTARLIEDAGFKAYQVGGFAHDAAEFAYPDIDLTRFAEKKASVERIIQGNHLPVLVDCDDGYGDAKNVTRTVKGYSDMGVNAIFIEDQKPPKKCGHMTGKVVIPADRMVDKIKAAIAAREDPDRPFILARTDAIQPEGLSAAIARATKYLNAGADGVYLEGPTSEKDLETIGKNFKGVPLATSILERGGATPWVAPRDLYKLGFTMILYPATVIFRVAKTIQDALDDLLQGKEITRENSVDMKTFEEILDIDDWKKIESKYHGGPESGEG